MSQAGIIDLEANNPQIPTLFITDVGSAIPILNTLEILGGPGVETDGSGNTITINVTAGAGLTLTGNQGGAISPLLGNWNTVGSGSITISGSGNSLTTSLTGLTNHAVLLGAGTDTITKVGPFASVGVPLVSQGVGTDPLFGTALVIGGGTGATAFNINGVVISNATTTTALSSLTLANGQFVIGSTGVAPVASTLTSASGTITITPGAGTLNIDLSGGGLAIDSFSPDSGTDPIVPTAAGLVNTKGSGSITTVGSLNTLTTQLTGLTNHAVLVGAGTTTITKIAATANTGAVLQNNSGADPSYSTATYPSTTTINQILYSSAANTVTGLATANRAVLTTSSAGVPALTALATDGQLIIGSTAGAPAAATLTPGPGISIANGSNSITISLTGGGFTWTDVTTATQALVASNGYITDRSGGVTYTLPASGTLGDSIQIIGKLGIAVITPNANQQILIGATSGTVGATGTATANNVGDCIELICITAGASSVWRSADLIGTWTLA